MTMGTTQAMGMGGPRGNFFLGNRPFVTVVSQSESVLSETLQSKPVDTTGRTTIDSAGGSEGNKRREDERRLACCRNLGSQGLGLTGAADVSVERTQRVPVPDATYLGPSKEECNSLGTEGYKVLKEGTKFAY